MNLWRCGYCLRTAAYCRRRGSSPVCDACRQALAGKGKKFCRQCCRALPVEQFYFATDGTRRATCGACVARGQSEQTRQNQQAWRRANRDRLNAYNRVWRKAKPEHAQAKRREYYLNRKIKASQRLRAGGA